MATNKSFAVVVGSPMTGSVGSPTVDKQVSQLIRPLRVVVEEVRALKEMGKDPISKDEAAIRRLLNALHRVFTIGAMGNNYGSFWDFLMAAEEQLERHQETAFDRLAKEAKEKMNSATGRARQSSVGPNADAAGGGSSAFSAKPSSNACFASGFPPSTPSQRKALIRSIEHVRSFNILNKLNCLHYWIITALQQGGVLSAALTCAIVPMRDVLQAYLGPDSPFYAKQSAATEEGDDHTAILCYPFLNELLKVFEELEHHPDLGTICYNLDITCMRQFQTVTDHNGNLIIGVNGADNTEQVEYFVPNALYTVGKRGRRRGRRNTHTIGTNTDAAWSMAQGGTAAQHVSPLSEKSPIASNLLGVESGVNGFLPSRQLMSEASAILAFNGDESQNQRADDASLRKSVLTFAELCEMQNSLLEEKEELARKDDALTQRELAIAQKEQEVHEASGEIIDVLLKLKDIYFKHVVGLRERQEMGLRITSKDIDRKIPQLLRIMEDSDFDMVADEDELNAAGQAKGSQRRFFADANVESSSANSRHRGSSVFVTQPSMGTKPLVIEDPDDAVPPHKVAGLIALRVTEPPEKERNGQLQAQNFLCADCGTSFGAEKQNMLLKTFQKTSEILTMQKPRRCHYCTQLLCHNCHNNQTALLPFRVIPKWDFSNKHVCKRCFTFLQQNYALAHYDIRTIPREIASNNVLQQCANVRKFLMRAAIIISGCTRPSSATFAQDLHTHYFQREFFYSMSDLNTLHSTEKRESNPAHIVPGVSNVVGAMQWVAGVNVENLVERLSNKLAQCKQHIKVDCANCKTRSSMPCSICSLTQPVFIVDEDGTQCRKCHTIFHSKCFETMGCIMCAHSTK